MGAMSELEPAVRQMFDATNRGDSAAFLGCLRRGRRGRRNWSHPRRRLDPGSVVAVSGDGYNGGGAFTFVLAGDKIARMVITG